MISRHLGALLDWTVADLAFLGIAIQQYISVSRDLKKSKKAEEEKQQANFLATSRPDD